jgi:transposase
MYRGSGSKPYDPMALLKMVLFQYLKGNQSPASWYDEAKWNEAMRWLGRGYVPARRTWYGFRDRFGKFIEDIHEEIISRALDEGHLDPAVGVQDGTAVAACASRHRTVNQSTLEERLGTLAKILDGDIQKKLPRWVPPTESGRLQLAQRMKHASEVLIERIAENARKPSDKRRDPKKIQVSLSDPTAPLGRDKLKVFRPLYTVQNMVAAKSNLIMAFICEAKVTDAGTLALMIDKTQKLVRGKLKTVIADSAYCSIVDLQDCRTRKIELLAPFQANSFTESKRKVKPTNQIPRDQFHWDEKKQLYRCPRGKRLNYFGRTRKKRHSGRTIWEYRYRCEPVHCGKCPLAKQCLRPGSASRTIKRLEDQELLDNHRVKMATAKAKALYRIRGQTIERTFGDSKGNRRLSRFHGRGLSRARAETGIMVIAQNLLILDRLQRTSTKPRKQRT